MIIDGFWAGQFAVDGDYDGHVEIEHLPCHTTHLYPVYGHETTRGVYLPDLIQWALDHQCPPKVQSTTDG